MHVSMEVLSVILFGVFFGIQWAHGESGNGSYSEATEVLILIYGFNEGLRLVNRQYGDNLSFRSVYVENSAILRCEDTGAYFDSVSEYYHRHRNSSQITVLFYCGCDSSPVFAQLGREWDMLVVNTGSVYSNLRDRVLHPTTIALGPLQFEIYGSTTRLILKKYGWTSIAYIYDVSGALPFNLVVYQRIRLHLKNYMPHVQVMPFQVNASEMNQILFASIISQITKITRIIFVTAPHPITRTLVIQAQKDGWAVGDLVWISPQVGLGLKTNVLWQQNDPEDKVALQGFRSVFKIQPCIQRPNTSETLDLLDQFRNYTKVNFGITYTEPNEFVFTAFAAVLWLAQILRKVRTAETRSGRLLARYFLNQTFSTPLTANYYVDEQGERQNQMCLMTFNASSRSFETALSYAQDVSKELISIDGVHIDWTTVDGQPPSDRPVCPGTSSGASSGQPPYCVKDLGVVPIAVPAAIALALLLSVTLYFHLRKVNSDWWLISRDNPAYAFRERTATRDQTKKAVQYLSRYTLTTVEGKA